MTDHNGIAQAEVSADYNIGPDNFSDWDPGQGPGDFGKDTRFWSVYRETGDGADNDQMNETQETPARGVEVGQVFRGWMTLSSVVQLPAHDTFWWSRGRVLAQARFRPAAGESVESFKVYLGASSQ